MTEKQIKHMVNRFLTWRLPENFNPDGGITFKRYFNEHTAHPMKSEPVGTNLFDYTQTEEMVRHMVEGIGIEGDKPPSPKSFKLGARCALCKQAPTTYVKTKGGFHRLCISCTSMIEEAGLEEENLKVVPLENG